jgi:hypothetical protein
VHPAKAKHINKQCGNSNVAMEHRAGVVTGVLS